MYTMHIRMNCVFDILYEQLWLSGAFFKKEKLTQRHHVIGSV